VDAIFADVDLPKDQLQFIEINAEMSRTCPTITDKKDPLPDAEVWKDATDKLGYLQR
jgi:ferredoxin